MCGVCEVDYALLEDLVENQKNDAGMYTLFQDQVKEGKGMDVVAEWFGRVSF